MKNIYFFIILLLLGGCATSYQVNVNGFAAGQDVIPAQSKIYVRSDPNVANMLFADQIKSKIQHLLVQNGYNPVNDPDNRYQMTFRLAGNDQILYDYNSIYASGGYGYGRYGYSYPGAAGSFGPYFRMVWNYMLVLRINDRHTNSQIWVGEAYTSKDYADKRQAVDYLLTALFRYFGQDTKKDITVTIKEADLTLSSKQ